MTAPARKQTHTLSLVVGNKPGVLVRIALVFARRGFNIESLVVSPGATGDFARMTITSSGDPQARDQIIRQLKKLIDVVFITDHSNESPLEIEIALVKLGCDLENRAQILQIAEHYNAKVVDYGTESMILRVYGTSDKLDAFLALLRPYVIEELVRTGKLVMSRGPSQFAHLLGGSSAE
jgi:acetolactate synthase-1/3 small subunit